MRYIIIGAGAVGGAIGGLAGRGGTRGRPGRAGAQRAALTEHGLRLKVPDGQSTYRLPVVEGPAELGELRADDVLVLTVKTQDVESALAVWGRHRSPGRYGRRAAAGRLRAERCGEPAPRAAPLPPGVRRLRLAALDLRRTGCRLRRGHPLTGILHLGRYPHGTDGTARLIAADLEKSRFEAPVVPDVARWQYAKLLSNLGNALEAVVEVLDVEAHLAFYARVRAEGVAVLDAAGIDCASAEEEKALRGDKIRLVEIDGVPPAAAPPGSR